jgi:hypothetical protein
MAFASHWVVTDHDLKMTGGFDHGPAGSFAAADRHLRGPLVAVGRRRAGGLVGAGKSCGTRSATARGATARGTCRSHAPEPLRARQLLPKSACSGSDKPVYSSGPSVTHRCRARRGRLWPNWQRWATPGRVSGDPARHSRGRRPYRIGRLPRFPASTWSGYCRQPRETQRIVSSSVFAGKSPPGRPDCAIRGELD